MKSMKRTIAVLVAVSLMLGGVIGGTLSWLTHKPDDVINTFTVGDINIVLDESKLKEDGTLDTSEKVQKNSFKMVPGWTIPKDPVVTVKADSEDCYVFIKVTESANLDNYIAYAIDTHNWTQLTDENKTAVQDVYYCEVKDVEKDRRIKILGPGSWEDSMNSAIATDDLTVSWKNEQVVVKPSVTKEMMQAIKDGDAENPTLTFQAFASQMYKNNTETFSAYEAWQNVSQSDTSNGSGTDGEDSSTQETT